MKTHYKLLGSTAAAYCNGSISRRRFIEEWRRAQQALGINAAKLPCGYTEGGGVTVTVSRPRSGTAAVSVSSSAEMEAAR